MCDIAFSLIVFIVDLVALFSETLACDIGGSLSNIVNSFFECGRGIACSS